MESTQPKRRSPRPPQPPIDPALVVPGARFQKNRAEDIGREPTFVIVDVVNALIVAGEVEVSESIVHYHNEKTLRRGKMPLRDFCQGSEHRLPDPPPLPEPATPFDFTPDGWPRAPEPPPSGERETLLAERDLLLAMSSRMATIEACQTEILALLKRPGQAQLPLVGVR